MNPLERERRKRLSNAMMKLVGVKNEDYLEGQIAQHLLQLPDE